MKKLLIILLILFLGGCIGGGTEPVARSAADGLTSRDQDALELFEDYYQDWLALHPWSATRIGDERYNDFFENYLAPDFRERIRLMTEKYLHRADAINPEKLSNSTALSYAIFVKKLKAEHESVDYPDHLLPINQFYNLTSLLARMGSGTGYQPFNSTEDYENWLKRMHSIKPLIEQAIVNMKEGVAEGIVQPRALMLKVLPQIEVHLVSDVHDSVFFKPLNAFPASVSDEDRIRLVYAYTRAIEDEVLPSFQRLHDYIQTDYIPHCRTSSGLGELPGGLKWYEYKVRTITGLSVDAEAIHQVGLSEVARIQNAMQEEMEKFAFKGTLQEFFKFLTEDPRFIYESTEKLLNAFHAVNHHCRGVMSDLFEMMPETDFVILPVEKDREKSASAASYRRPSADGSRPGACYINTYDLASRPSWAVAPLLLHETLPGHHLQFSIQQQLKALPNFRRFGRETAFTEGWALYAESLGYEMGLYDTPDASVGVLVAELWRAIRLVVDTGLHAKGWSREQAIDYMLSNAPVTRRRAVSETERYLAIPAQALAYKVGQLKIQSLRDRAKLQLGDQFNLKKFHTEVLKEGAMPLSLLEERIDDWIESQKGQ